MFFFFIVPIIFPFLVTKSVFIIIKSFDIFNTSIRVAKQQEWKIHKI
jgi:hypothetical protein